MDWTRAIERNRRALLALVGGLFLLLEQHGYGLARRVPPPVKLALLRILRPAESAVRRLIVIAARGLAAKPFPSRPMPAGRIITGKGCPAQPAFRLFDPRKSFVQYRRRKRPPEIQPRISVIGYDPRVAALWPVPRPAAAAEAPPSGEDGLAGTEALCRRLQALKLALDDVPRQARRLVRCLARRERAERPREGFLSPLRIGRPPGYRAKQTHEVDAILTECHDLAIIAQRPDTS